MAVDIGFKLKHRSKDKLADYQDGTCYLTSHRIIYVDNAKPRERAAQIELSLVKDIESYVNIWYQGFIGTLLWRAIVSRAVFCEPRQNSLSTWQNLLLDRKLDPRQIHLSLQPGCVLFVHFLIRAVTTYAAYAALSGRIKTAAIIM